MVMVNALGQTYNREPEDVIISSSKGANNKKINEKWESNIFRS